MGIFSGTIYCNCLWFANFTENDQYVMMTEVHFPAEGSFSPGLGNACIQPEVFLSGVWPEALLSLLPM